ncbi:hypothetical protein OG21DRAFT_609791 [Imleria badia]|nr:hypothetical protein OG21DRAFT_609791 [Imleria badia]
MKASHGSVRQSRVVLLALNALDRFVDDARQNWVWPGNTSECGRRQSVSHACQRRVGTRTARIDAAPASSLCLYPRPPTPFATTTGPVVELVARRTRLRSNPTCETVLFSTRPTSLLTELDYARIFQARWHARCPDISILATGARSIHCSSPPPFALTTGLLFSSPSQISTSTIMLESTGLAGTRVA